MSPNPRVLSAFRAMKAIGISEVIVKPVLKKLLVLYEKNWELIEAENYRALADAIFDNEDLEAAEKNKKIVDPNEGEDLEGETRMHDEPDCPLKRSRIKDQDGQASPSVTDLSPKLKRPKIEADELDEASVRRQSVSPLPLDINKDVMNSADNHSSLMRKDKGKEPLLPQTSPRDYRLFTERSSHGVRIREQVDAGISVSPKQKVPDDYALMKPKDKPSTAIMGQLEVVTAVVNPEPVQEGHSSVENASVTEPAAISSQFLFENDKSDDLPDLDIAAALCGEVNISASDCSGLGKPVEHCAEVPLNDPQKVQSDAEVAQPPIPRSPPPCTGMDGSLQPDDNGVENHCKADTERELDVLDLSKCNSLLGVQKHQSVSNHSGSLGDANDLSKGQEKVTILWQNDINFEVPSFNYIPGNVVFQKAHVNISLARIRESSCSNCSGNCLLSSTPCACSDETCGENAYTLEGLVNKTLLEQCISMKREPHKRSLSYCEHCPLERYKNEATPGSCKGHLVRKFIKECWWKCGCSKKCGNRVVQRGIDRKLQVFMTPGGKGWGLRTLENLPKGAFVCEYVGELLTNAELYDRVVQGPNTGSHRYSVLLDAKWSSEKVLKDEETLCLDATNYGNVARFINHRCSDSNLIEIPVEMETPDHHYYHVSLFTTREVKAMEELTWDYGIDFSDQEHPIKAFQCLCGSKFCRDMNQSIGSWSIPTMR